MGGASGQQRTERIKGVLAMLVTMVRFVARKCVLAWAKLFSELMQTECVLTKVLVTPTQGNANVDKASTVVQRRHASTSTVHHLRMGKWMRVAVAMGRVTLSVDNVTVHTSGQVTDAKTGNVQIQTLSCILTLPQTPAMDVAHAR